jgi:hypothetical protein
MSVFGSWLRILCVVLLLSGVAYPAAYAAGEAVNQNDLAAQKELLQTQIEAAKALQQKETDAINKRIDDQLVQVGQGVDRFGILISVLLAGAGLLGY